MKADQSYIIVSRTINAFETLDVTKLDAQNTVTVCNTLSAGLIGARPLSISSKKPIKEIYSTGEYEASYYGDL